MAVPVTVKFLGDNRQLRESMTEVMRGSEQMKGALEAVAPAIAGAFTVAGAVALAKQLMETGAEIEKMSITTGLSAESVQRFKFAAEQSETSVESLNKALIKMQRSQVAALQNPGGNAANGFAQLGITIQQLQSLSPEELFLKLADGVKNSSDESVALNAVMEVMGKTGADTFSMLVQGADELRKKFSEAPIISNEDVAGLAEMNKEVKSLGSTLMANLAPVLTTISKLIRSLFAELKFFGEIAGVAFSTKWWNKEDRKIGSAMMQDSLSGMGKTIDEIWNPKAPEPPKPRGDHSDIAGKTKPDKEADSAEKKRLHTLEEIKKLEDEIFNKTHTHAEILAKLEREKQDSYNAYVAKQITFDEYRLKQTQLMLKELGLKEKEVSPKSSPMRDVKQHPEIAATNFQAYAAGLQLTGMATRAIYAQSAGSDPMLKTNEILREHGRTQEKIAVSTSETAAALKNG